MHTHLVVVITCHGVGKGDLRLEHLPAVHELHQQVTHRLELHPLGRLDVGQDQTWKDLEREHTFTRDGQTPPRLVHELNVKDTSVTGQMIVCGGMRIMSFSMRSGLDIHTRTESGFMKEDI